MEVEKEAQRKVSVGGMQMQVDPFDDSLHLIGISLRNPRAWVVDRTRNFELKEKEIGWPSVMENS